MTVIAWDGTSLAADKLVCHGATRSTVTKIQRFNDCLLGVTGDLSIGMEMLQWFKEGAISKDYPPANRSLDSGASLIVVRHDRTVWEYESSPLPFRVEGSFCAFGSGDEGAMIAMACGVDAKQAVEVVSQYNCGCGNGVDVLTLSIE